MHDKLQKILGKKRDLSPAEKSAKMDVIKEMRDEASKAMGDKMDHLKKVSVMSNSPEGLSHGLDKAKELVGSQDDQDQPMMSEGGQVMSDEEEHQMLEDSENDMADVEHAHEEHEGEEGHEESESPEEEASEDDESMDSLEAKIQELMKKKESLAKR